MVCGKSRPRKTSTKIPLQREDSIYPGPEALYHFVNIDVKISTKLTFHFLSSQMVTSNIEAYYPLLAQQYNDGYRLLTFCQIPCQVCGHVCKWCPNAVSGICCKYPDSPTKAKFQLSIEKSVIQPQNVWSGLINARSEAVTDTSHTMQTIVTKAQAGARLVCIELTGEEEYQASFNLPQKMPNKPRSIEESGWNKRQRLMCLQQL